MRSKFYVSLAMLCCIAGGLLFLIFDTVLPTTILSPLEAGITIQAPLSPQQAEYELYLPLIVDKLPPLTAKFGIQLQPEIRQYVSSTETVAADLAMAHEMGSRWNRVSVPWNEIETAPGVYDWQVMDAVITQTVAAGFEPLGMVWGAPEWAAEQSCGPIRDIAAFENFLEALFTRYRTDVDAWEFTNEPDRRDAHPSWGPVVGCWGLEAEAYADQLGVFYRSARQFDPSALVVSGGLAYDGWENHERSFWENILAAGAGQYFDVANIHYYPINALDFPTMAHKVDEIRATMKRYGVDHKPIWVTETGMWTNDIIGGDAEKQRDFIVKEQTRGFAAGVDNIFWFDPRVRIVPSNFVERFLFTEDHEPLTGYATYQFYANKVSGMIPVQGSVSGLPTDIEAYRFYKGSSELFIVWSNTVTQTLTFTSDIDALVSDRDGTATTTVVSQNGEVMFEVGPLPRYVEFISDEN